MVSDNSIQSQYVCGENLKKIPSSKLSVAFSEKSLCTRCGTCVGACPEKALIIGKDFYPEVNEELCTECDICIETCPGAAVNFQELAEITFGNSNQADSFDGEVLKTYVGYSTDSNIRGGGAGGVSSLGYFGIS